MTTGRRARAALAGTAVAAAAGSGVATELVTDQHRWVWAVALGVLVLVAIASQMWITLTDHPGGRGRPVASSSVVPASEAEPLPRRPVPRQVPATSGRFVGRVPELDQLDRLLDQSRADPSVNTGNLRV